MKAMHFLMVLSMFFLISSCSKDSFEGSNISDETRFILDFELLNKTVVHSIELEESDIIDVVINRESGELDLLVKEETGDLIYKADDASSGEFALEISQSGTYEFEVTGRKAAGYVSFIKRE